MATILIIDDEASMLDMLTNLLERAGHNIISFLDAKPALKEMVFDHIDLFITDLDMPMRGEEALLSIRSSGITVPIIVLSGYLQPGDVELLKSMGANRVLSKPIRMETLLHVVNDLLPTR